MRLPVSLFVDVRSFQITDELDLDYFMNAPKQSPYVDDLKIRYKVKGVPDWYFAYGPYDAKVLRNWIGDGFYTQRNADTYAW